MTTELLPRIQQLADAQVILSRARMATCTEPGNLPYSIVLHASDYLTRQIDELWAAEIGRPIDARAELGKADAQGLDKYEVFG